MQHACAFVGLLIALAVAPVNCRIYVASIVRCLM